MYEKVFSELDSICTLPCPITQPGVQSPVDQHVGTSLYDRDGDKLEEVDGGAGSEDQRGEEVDLEGQRELAASLAAVAEGIGGMGLESGLLEMSEVGRMPRLSDVQVCVCGDSGGVWLIMEGV